jgi:hypothetical protein
MSPLSSGTAATKFRAPRPSGYGEWISTGTDGRADPTMELPQGSSATSVGTWRNRLTAHFLPLAIAAAFVGSPPVREVRRVFLTGSETWFQEISWDEAEDFWVPVLEPITNDQVRALNALLAIPYTNDHGFEYFADE